MIACCDSTGGRYFGIAPGEHMVDLSVVIVSYNTCNLLDDCLASVFANGGLTASSANGKASLEVIVVDNGSRDGSANMVRCRYPHVRVVALTDNTGFAHATNEGMIISRGRYILLLNSDTIVLDQALARMVAFLDSHPEFAAIGPLLLNRDGTIQTSCFSFTTVRDILFESIGLTALFPNSSLFNRRGLGGFDRSVVREVDWLSGACLMVRREVIHYVGLLDEEFFMYGEELDWCYRMKQARLRIAFFPEARVIHYGRGSSTRTRGELAPRALAGRLRYFRKYHGPRAVLAVRLLTIVGMSLRLLVLPLRALIRRSDVANDFAWYWGLLCAAVRD